MAGGHLGFIAGPLAAVTNHDAVMLGVAAAVAFAAWLVLAGVVLVATRPKLPDPGPATMELGPEPPAVANFLVNRWEVTSTAVAATLLDLAARRFLDIEQVAPETFLCRLYAQRAPKGELNPYETEVLDLVRDKATREGTVACQELSLGQGEHAAAWWKRFSKQVVDDARQRGLARRRWGALQVGVLAVSLAIPAALGGGALEVVNAVHRAQGSTAKGDDLGGGLAVALVAWFAVLALGGRMLRAWRDTPAGQAAAARWLGFREYVAGAVTLVDAPPAAVTIWGRNLSYGVALGACRTSAGYLPIGPERDDEAWSAYGGLWREVRIRYPQRFAEGEPPPRATLAGLAWLVFSGILTLVVFRAIVPIIWDLAGRLRGHGSNPLLFLGFGLLAIAIFSIPMVWCSIKLTRAIVILTRSVPDLSQRVTFDGQVLRVPQRWINASDSSPGHWAPSGFTAVDDGKGQEIRALRFYRPDIREGHVVRVTMSPRLRHVYSCDVLAGATAERRWQAATGPAQTGTSAGAPSAGGSPLPAPDGLPHPAGPAAAGSGVPPFSGIPVPGSPEWAQFVSGLQTSAGGKGGRLQALRLMARMFSNAAAAQRKRSGLDET